jgi:hypothetical protein
MITEDLWLYMRLSHNPVQPFGRRPQWSVDPILWASGAAEWRSSTEHAAQNELDFSRSRVVQQPHIGRRSSVIIKRGGGAWSGGDVADQAADSVGEAGGDGAEE